MILALAGNQNSGKTTLFNQLTGSNQHVGNFPGVTVEKKEGAVKGFEEAIVVDLPGAYSLSPYTAEEGVTRDFLLKSNPDGIINIVDATNIQRGLYFSLQLIELGLPLVIALNMMDEVKENGGTIRTEILSRELGVPIIPISAAKNQGISQLVDSIGEAVKNNQRPEKYDFCPKGQGPAGAVHRAIHAVSHLIEDHAEAAKMPLRFAAIGVVTGDKAITDTLKLSANELETVEHFVKELEAELELDCQAAMADARYKFIEGVCSRGVVRPAYSKSGRRSERLDKFLTNRYLAIPIFIAIMLLIFWLTFGVIGAFLSDGLAVLTDSFSGWVERLMIMGEINPIIRSLVVDGAIAGVGSVISFLPTIVVLFFFLSLLEDSGYMARVAFVMDKLLRGIGLSGRSFVPMLIGFGCSVPAIMATRTLASRRDRQMTMLLIPFMSCSAKLPIMAVFSMAFFPEHSALVMISLYVLGMILGVAVGLLLKKFLFFGKPSPFIMELPHYRMPGLKSVMLLLWDKAKDFLVRAFTVIFLASLVIWFLRTFDIRLNVAADSGDSLLAGIGRLIAPVLTPLGFGDWRAATALITGFTAKEAVISTLAVLLGDPATGLSLIFTPMSALSFLVFTLLYTPCVAAVQAVRREAGTGFAVKLILFQTALAWAASFLAYRIIMFFA